MLKTATGIAFIFLAGAATAANAAELKVLVSGAMAHALQHVSEDFVRKNGDTLDFTVGTTGTVQEKVRAGEKADVIEVTSAGMDALEKEKLIVPGTRVDLARALIGIAVPEGAPAPDLSTPDALKRRLLAARAVSYIDPKLGGQAGDAIIGALKDMGIADEVARKSVHGKTGAEAVQKMVSGDADIVISYVSEILPIKGAKLAGPLPPALQNPATFSGAVGAASAHPEAARALLAAMTGPEGSSAITDAGLEPLAAH